MSRVTWPALSSSLTIIMAGATDGINLIKEDDAGLQGERQGQGGVIVVFPMFDIGWGAAWGLSPCSQQRWASIIDLPT